MRPWHLISFDKTSLRHALAAFTTGVTVVTTRSADARDIGMTANSFNSVSLDPPMVLWSLAKASGNFMHFRDATYFAVHILAAHQDMLSNQFSAKNVDRFARLVLDRGKGEIPLLSGCFARFECRAAHRYEGGDHIILVGEVYAFTHSAEVPLAFQGGRYGVIIANEFRTALEACNSGDDFPEDLFYYCARLYHNLRQDIVDERQRRGWTSVEYHAIALLATEGNLHSEYLADRLRVRGFEIDGQSLGSLMEKNIIAHSDGLLALSESGRAQFIDVAARSKVAESIALNGFDLGEMQVLKALLARLVRNIKGARETATNAVKTH